MLFGMLSRLDPRNHILDGGSNPPWKGAILSAEGHAPSPDISDDPPDGENISGHARQHSAVSYAKRPNPSRCHLGCALRWAKRTKYRKGPNLPCEKLILGKRTCPGITEDTVPWAAQKWLNSSRCCLGFGLGWAQGSMCYMIVRIGASWRIYDWTVHVRWAEWSGGDAALRQITLTTCSTSCQLNRLCFFCEASSLQTYLSLL